MQYNGSKKVVQVIRHFTPIDPCKELSTGVRNEYTEVIDLDLHLTYLYC